MISRINNIPNISYNRINNPISFKGIKNKDEQSLFVFDLDGTLATANQNRMQLIFEKAKDCNAEIVYATGRTYKEFLKLQNKLLENGVNLPNPKYLIVNNGQFLYENIDGFMVEETDYQTQLRNNTHFDRDIVFQTMKEFSKKEKYRYTDDELNSLPNLDEVKKSDPEFYNSRISYYEWNPSENMTEYFLSYDVDTKELKAEIVDELAKKGIKVRFRENHYTKPIMDACREDILLQSNKLRRHKDGSMTALFLCAADKADGIDYIRKKHKINYSEILMAGNDDNDIPMAGLSIKGANFICLKDSSKSLLDYCTSIKDNIYFSVKNGSDAIIEGIKHLIGY